MYTLGALVSQEALRIWQTLWTLRRTIPTTHLTWKFNSETLNECTSTYNIDFFSKVLETVHINGLRDLHFLPILFSMIFEACTGSNKSLARKPRSVSLLKINLTWHVKLCFESETSYEWSMRFPLSDLLQSTQLHEYPFQQCWNSWNSEVTRKLILVHPVEYLPDLHLLSCWRYRLRGFKRLWARGGRNQSRATWLGELLWEVPILASWSSPSRPRGEGFKSVLKEYYLSKPACEVTANLQVLLSCLDTFLYLCEFSKFTHTVQWRTTFNCWHAHYKVDVLVSVTSL